MSFDSLPADLIPLIGIHLSLVDLLRLSLTGKRYYRLCRTSSLLARFVSGSVRTITHRFPFVKPGTHQIQTRSIFVRICDDCGDTRIDRDPKCRNECQQCRKSFCSDRMTRCLATIERMNGSYVLGESCDVCPTCLSGTDSQSIKYVFEHKDGWKDVIIVSRIVSREHDLTLHKNGWIKK